MFLEVAHEADIGSQGGGRRTGNFLRFEDVAIVTLGKQEHLACAMPPVVFDLPSLGGNQHIVARNRSEEVARPMKPDRRVRSVVNHATAGRFPQRLHGMRIDPRALVDPDPIALPCGRMPAEVLVEPPEGRPPTQSMREGSLNPVGCLKIGRGVEGNDAATEPLQAPASAGGRCRPPPRARYRGFVKAFCFPPASGGGCQGLIAEVRKTLVNVPLPGLPVSARLTSCRPRRIACQARHRSELATL